MKRVAPQRNICYFANDGTYGDASGLLIVDVTDWNETNWRDLDDVGDHNRLVFAKLMAQTKESKWIAPSM